MPLDPVAQFINREGGLTFLALSADGKVLAGMPRQSSGVRVWDVASKEELGRPGRSFRSYQALALAPDGKALAVASHVFGQDVRSASLEVSDIGTGKTIAELAGMVPPVAALTFSAEGRRLAAGDHQGNVRVWQRE